MKKQYIAIGKTDLFYNSMGLCGNFTQYRVNVALVLRAETSKLREN